MWSIIGLVASAFGIFCEYMSEKEEREEQDLEMQDLRDRVRYLESKEDKHE